MTRRDCKGVADMGVVIENHILLRYEAEPDVTRVEIPVGVTAIGEDAFSDCNVKDGWCQASLCSRPSPSSGGLLPV